MDETEPRSQTDRARQFEGIFGACYSRVLGFAIRRSDERATDEPAGPTLLRATVYEEARGTRSLSEKEGMWLSGFEPSAYRGQVGSDYLNYRVPDGVGTD